MRDKINEYIKNHIKGYELEGVEFCDEDYEFVEKLITEGKSLEDAWWNDAGNQKLSWRKLRRHWGMVIILYFRIRTISQNMAEKY